MAALAAVWVEDAEVVVSAEGECCSSLSLLHSKEYFAPDRWLTA